MNYGTQSPHSRSYVYHNAENPRDGGRQHNCGDPIPAGDGVTLIPVSRLSFGFASGGSDFTAKNQKPDATNAFGGGSGAGVTITPVAFLIVKGDSVKLLPVSLPAGSTIDRVVELVPDLVDKVTGFIEKQQGKDKEAF